MFILLLNTKFNFLSSRFWFPRTVLSFFLVCFLHYSLCYFPWTLQVPLRRHVPAKMSLQIAAACCHIDATFVFSHVSFFFSLCVAETDRFTKNDPQLLSRLVLVKWLKLRSKTALSWWSSQSREKHKHVQTGPSTQQAGRYGHSVGAQSRKTYFCSERVYKAF